MNDPSVPPARFLEFEREKTRREKEAASAHHLSQSLDRLMKDLAPARGKDPIGSLEDVCVLWRQAVGDQLGNLSEPYRWQGGVLTVRVHSIPLATELQGFKEKALVARLSEAGLEGIHSIRFRGGERFSDTTKREGCEN